MTANDDRPLKPAPRCAICGKPIPSGGGRLRRGLASVHVECAEREDKKLGKSFPRDQSFGLTRLVK